MLMSTTCLIENMSVRQPYIPHTKEVETGLEVRPQGQVASEHSMEHIWAR